MFLFHLSEKLFEPIVIAALLGWGLVFWRGTAREKYAATAIGALLVWMIAWRYALVGTRRYFSVLILLLLPMCGIAFCVLHRLIRERLGGKIAARISVLLFALLLLGCILKTFRPAPYSQALQAASEWIQAESERYRSPALIYLGGDCRIEYYSRIATVAPAGVPHEIPNPDFIPLLSRTLRQYQYYGDILFFVFKTPARAPLLTGEELELGSGQWQFLKRFRMDKRNRYELRVYAYTPGPEAGAAKGMLRSSTPPPADEAGRNWLKNGDFEQAAAPRERAQIVKILAGRGLSYFCDENLMMPEGWRLTAPPYELKPYDAAQAGLVSPGLSGTYAFGMRTDKTLVLYSYEAVNCGNYELTFSLESIRESRLAIIVYYAESAFSAGLQENTYGVLRFDANEKRTCRIPIQIKAIPSAGMFRIGFALEYGEITLDQVKLTLASPELQAQQ